MGLSNQCQPGCMSYDGGEVKHRRDCVHYPESLTKLWHDTEAELQAEIDRLRGVLGVAVHRLSRAADACADVDLSDPRIDQLSEFAVEIESAITTKEEG